MSKSTIYIANTNSQTVTDGGVVNFGSIVRRYGCNLSASGGNVIVNGCGYYQVTANLTLTSATAGNIVAKLYKDGVEISGANASITSVVGDVFSIVIPAIIRDNCCCDSTITCTLTGATAIVTNAAMEVIKL